MAEKKSVKSINPLNNGTVIILLTLILGLAPIFPEPHILGKLKWLAGGAVGMKLIDWGDLLFHGFPWVLLIRLSLLQLKAKFKTAKAWR